MWRLTVLTVECESIASLLPGWYLHTCAQVVSKHKHCCNCETDNSSHLQNSADVVSPPRPYLDIVDNWALCLIEVYEFQSKLEGLPFGNVISLESAVNTKLNTVEDSQQIDRVHASS